VEIKHFVQVGLFGVLAQFIASLHGFKARDTLVTVTNIMWSSYWMTIGFLHAFGYAILESSTRILS
jgi:hypothetical protein